MSTGIEESIILNQQDQKIIFLNNVCIKNTLLKIELKVDENVFILMKSGEAALKNGHPRITGCDNLTKDALPEGHSMNDSKQRFSKGFLCVVIFLNILGDLPLNGECYKNKQFVNFW